MKILSAEKIKEGDVYTITHEPIKSIDLMERAATSCVNWLSQLPGNTIFAVFCGVGNNGGDGLAISRILKNRGFRSETFLVKYKEELSNDCKINLDRLKESYGARYQEIKTLEQFPTLPESVVIIDALLGTGTNRPLSGLLLEIVQALNTLPNKIVAIDMPSGLQAESNSREGIHINASTTLSLEHYKLSFFFKENAFSLGEVVIRPIGIHADFIASVETPYHIITPDIIRKIYKRRVPYSHKGTYGHALMIAGSYGKMGAAVLTTRAALKAGAGLVTALIPTCGYAILQSVIPEVMCLTDDNDQFITGLPPRWESYDSIGIGPGLGKQQQTANALKQLLKSATRPLVLDADALNLISEDPSLLTLLPQNCILTPHPKEFERLFGKTSNSFERLELQVEKSRALKVIIVLKDHKTSISLPNGQVWFNQTGNAGMATGGSGDVLTGIIAGLVAQAYSTEQAAILGVYLHGRAGDLYADVYSQETLMASDLIEQLGMVFKEIAQ